MATPDYTAADPQAPGGSLALLGYANSVTAHNAKNDYNTQMKRSTQEFQYQLPQLQSGIASSGNYYSSARQGAETHAAQSLTNQQTDLESALNRQLDDLQRQQVYAAMGLVV